MDAYKFFFLLIFLWSKIYQGMQILLYTLLIIIIKLLSWRRFAELVKF